MNGKKTNNKGFTLIEMLITIAILSILMIVLIISVSNTFGLTNEKSYEILKQSIITQVNEYIYECDNGLIYCKNDYTWKEIGDKKEASFYLEVMKKYAYFNENDYINPITNKYIGNCLIINVTKDKFSTLNITLDDRNCEK